MCLQYRITYNRIFSSINPYPDGEDIDVVARTVPHACAEDEKEPCGVYPEGIEHELCRDEADQRVEALDERKDHFRLGG